MIVSHVGKDVCVCVPVQLERVLYSLVAGLLYQLGLEVLHTHSPSDDGVQQWLEEPRNDRLEWEF